MHQNVRKLTLWALLLLPLVAVGVAVTLMVSWGSQPAEAAGTVTELSINGVGLGAGCDTSGHTKGACSVPVGGAFTVQGAIDKVGTGLVDADGDMKNGYNGIQIRFLASAGLTHNPRALTGEVVNCAGGISAESPAVASNDYTPACNIGISANERTDTGVHFEVDYTCTTQGAQTITAPNGGPPDSHVTDENNAAAPDGVEIDTLNVFCAPPDRQIDIDKVDDVTGALIGPSCWQVFVHIKQASPPVALNVPVDVVGDNGKLCTGAGGIFSDKNPALGQIDITISGAARAQAGSDDWHVLETQTPPKYNFGAQGLIKQECILSAADCSLVIGNTRVSGNINVAFNDTVTGLPLAGQCVDVSGVGTFCDPNTTGITVPLGAYTCTYNPINLPADRQVKAPTAVDCSVSVTAPKASVKYNFNPTIPFNLKSPTLANLFLTAQGSKLGPTTCAGSSNVQTFSHLLSSAPSSADPKDPLLVQQVGGFEMNVLFDEDLICVNLFPGAYFTGTAGGVCFIDDKDQGLQPDGLARIGCVIKGKPATVSSSLQLAVITVRPQPELYKLITADQDNGVNAHILNSGCNLADMQGHPIKKVGCDDSQVTIRWLEGDVNGDCAVDVRDQQILAFRWGAKIGSGLLYNPRFDLEPSGQINSDGDIDIKDVQFVYGRHGSVCTKDGVSGSIWPPQPPRNSKQTEPLP